MSQQFWTACEFEKLLGSYGWPEDQYARKLPNRGPAAISMVSGAVCSFHNGTYKVQHGLIARWKLWLLIERTIATTCPKCGVKFRGDKVGRTVAQELAAKWA